MKTINYAGQSINTLKFDNKMDLKQKDSKVHDEVWSKIMMEGYYSSISKFFEDMPGTIVYGNIIFPHTEDTKASSFEDIYLHLDEDFGKWLIFTGNLAPANSLALTSKERVIVLGNLSTVGVSNDQGLLHVEGETTITGALMFDSGNGGFTSLRLKNTPGFVFTNSNAFDINLKAKYYFDNLFRCGFTGTPTTAHEEIIMASFESTKDTVQVHIDHIADFFTLLNEGVAEEVRTGAHRQWREYVIVKLNSQAIAAHFDKICPS